MHELAYELILFDRHAGGVRATARLNFENQIAAVGEAQRLAQEAAGAVVIGRLNKGDAGQGGEMEIIFRTGEGPERLLDFIADVQRSGRVSS